MKIIEDIQSDDMTIRDTIRKIITGTLDDNVGDLSDEKLSEIMSALTISDLIALDDAYTSGDNETMQEILGSDIQLEYSMGGRGDVNSAAQTRQQSPRAEPKPVATPAAKPQQQSHYSTGMKKMKPDEVNVISSDGDEEVVERIQTLAGIKK